VSETSSNSASSAYARSGVDTAAGDLAVELMKSAVARTHGPEVLGGVGGFAGMFDASALLGYKRPLLASSTDGVGTKVAIAQAIDKHDTIGQDLVAMVVDDIVVVGAKPLFMTDYIACGKVVPQRIADIVRGIAEACEATGTALVGGETAEHPGLLGVDEYDVAGAATGVVEADKMLAPTRVEDGDVVLAMAASGLHSNGFSLVRHILSERGIGYGDRSDAAHPHGALHRAAAARARGSRARRCDPRAQPRHGRRDRREPGAGAAAGGLGRAGSRYVVAAAGVPPPRRTGRAHPRVA
jgi:phosphoribosylformylglycinamidine cyclo-ligase